MSVSLGDLDLLPAKALFIRSLRAIVFADCHIGLEYAFAESGSYVPPVQYKMMKRQILGLVREYKPERIIIVGDLKHTFSRKTPQEHKEVIDMLRTLKRLGIETYLVRGNHDNFIVGVLEKYSVHFVRELKMGEYLFIHGHAKPSMDYKDSSIIMAHIHPTITFSDSVSREKFPVFLIGQGKIVLPAFTPLLPGFDVIAGAIEEDYGSPLIEDFSNFMAYVVIESRRVIPMGKIRELLGILTSSPQ